MAARFDAVGLIVADLEASVSFYRLLGMEFTIRAARKAISGHRAPGAFA